MEYITLNGLSASFRLSLCIWTFLRGDDLKICRMIGLGFDLASTNALTCSTVLVGCSVTAITRIGTRGVHFQLADVIDRALSEIFIADAGHEAAYQVHSIHRVITQTPEEVFPARHSLRND